MIEYDIQNTLSQKGCLICNLVKKRMDEKLWWFKTENYHEIETLKELKNNPYICDKHKKQLTDMRDRLSVTFEFLIKKDTELFNSLLASNSKQLQKKIKNLTFDRCQFCIEEAKIEQFVVETFYKMLKDEKIKTLYKNSDGLCRKHLMQCLSIIDKTYDRSSFLIEDTLHRLSKIDSYFKEFFHKSDYRFSSEQKGEEQNAWLYALNFYSNAKK